MITDQGIKPNTERVAAINEILKPEGKPDLQRFLGMVNYVSKFITNFSEISAPLRQLLHKNTVFIWQPEHQKAFEDRITSPPVISLL